MKPKFTQIFPWRSSSKRCELAICSIFRNEGNYLQEWLEFHEKNGVTRFFLINHLSEDNFRTVLEPWIRKGIVTLVEATSDDQVFEYNKILARFGSQVKWMAFIDIDEFLFSPGNIPLPNVLEKFSRASGVFVYWRLFGSSEVQHQPDQGKTLETFQLCLAPPRDLETLEKQRSAHNSIRGESKMTGNPIQGKCIIKPSKVSEMGAHWPSNFTGAITDERGFLSRKHFPSLRPCSLPSTEILRINHYWSRSLEELKSKALRQPVHKGMRENPKLKALPGNRSLRWDTYLNKSLDNAALVNIGSDLPFVFFIGFNKTATRSLHYLLERNGFPAIHWDRNRLVAAMLDNKRIGQRILLGYEHFRVFSDLTLITDQEYFEGNSMFRELFESYPSAYFILNNRDTDDWIKSRLNQNSGLFSRRHLQIRGIKTTQELSLAWASEKSAHEQAVREFFLEHPRFLEIDINEHDVPSKLEKFLGREFAYTEWKVVRSIRQVLRES